MLLVLLLFFSTHTSTTAEANTARKYEHHLHLQLHWWSVFHGLTAYILCSEELTHSLNHIHTHTHHTHTHSHTHNKNKMDKCKELPHWVTPPQPKAGAPVCYFRELWASTRQTPEARPSTRRSTDCALQLWCGHPKSHLDLSGISTASGLVHPQPRPGSQFTIFLGPG